MSFPVSRRLAVAAAAAGLVLAGLIATPASAASLPVKCPPEPQMCLWTDDFICVEGGCQTLPVMRDCKPCLPLTIEYRIVDITTTAGRDYTARPVGRLTFATGATRVLLEFGAVADTVAELPETARIDLLTDGRIAAGALGTITDS